MTTKRHKGNGALVPALRDNARTVWLAGVGALATAEDEGTKLVGEGQKLFEQLVKHGKTYEARNRKRLDAMIGTVRDARAGVGTRIGRFTGRVTGPVNQAVEAALHRLGVPTRKEIATLTKRVEALTRAVAKSGKAHVAAE